MFNRHLIRASGHHGTAVHRPGRWVSFVRRYGWRAYALPILTVVTIAALVQTSADDAGKTTTARGAGVVASGRPGGAAVAKGGTAPTRAGSGRVRVEGLTADDAGFNAGSTPSPVVIDLGDDAVSCAANTDRRLLIVSVSKQHLWACQGPRQIRTSPVTTGATVDHDQTPLGSWRVQAKQRHRYLVGPGYRDYVQYWVPFDGDFGFHDASWQTMPFGSKDYPRRGSHGCVHVPTPTMAWLYHWAGVNDTVVTVEA